jgi:hypothetical protein
VGAQAASAVLMVRPAGFGFNPETGGSNRFQRQEAALVADAPTLAQHEFEGLVAALRNAGVTVVVVEDEAVPRCPDAIFPNNWVSLHADGTVVLYPMLARSRRAERRYEHLYALERATGRRVCRVVDLSHHELEGRYLEGTGSVVFDHPARVAYAALSPRTHREPLAELCAELGYRACVFRAADRDGVAIYHTNVMLAIGSGFAVVATEAIDRSQRDDVLRELRHEGRTVIEIDGRQMASFAGNVLELRAADGARVLAMSSAAAQAFGASLDALGRCVDRVVTAAIPTIETLGGGSVRCMLAEVFLPE